MNNPEDLILAAVYSDFMIIAAQDKNLFNVYPVIKATWFEIESLASVLCVSSVQSAARSMCAAVNTQIEAYLRMAAPAVVKGFDSKPELMFMMLPVQAVGFCCFPPLQKGGGLGGLWRTSFQLMWRVAGFLGKPFLNRWEKAGYFWRVFWRVLASLSFFGIDSNRVSHSYGDGTTSWYQSWYQFRLVFSEFSCKTRRKWLIIDSNVNKPFFNLFIYRKCQKKYFQRWKSRFWRFSKFLTRNFINFGKSAIFHFFTAKIHFFRQNNV